MGFSVLVLTWDANGRQPGSSELSHLLRRNFSPDLYAIGLQGIEKEEESESRYSFAFRRREEEKKVTKEEEWGAAIQSALRGYVPLTAVKMEGLLLFVFMREILTPVLENVEVRSCRIYGARREEGVTKGAVSARFEMGGVSFSFTNLHLSKDEEERNREFSTVVESLRFEHGKKTTDHDHTFIFGSLHQGASFPETIFEGFWEGQKASNSSRGESDPARVMYTGHGVGLKQEEYESHSYYGGKGHAPTTATYWFGFPTFVKIEHSEAWAA